MSFSEKENDRHSSPTTQGTPSGGGHFNAADVMRDVIIGFADGLTVPFALTAALSSLGSTKLVIVGGLAELFSGAISMGLGAYLAAATERDRYLNEENKTKEAAATELVAKKRLIYDVFSKYGVDQNASNAVADDLVKNEDSFVWFMMDFSVKVEKPNVSRAWISAATMGLAYFAGGFIPLTPYFFTRNVFHGLLASIALTFLILVIFGFIRGYVTLRTKRAGFYGAVQTLFVGALAAGTSYGIVRAINHSSLSG